MNNANRAVLKSITIILVILVIALIIVFWPVIQFWLGFGGGTYFTHVPEPKIKYGEFPFRLTYELNGETIMIEDTVICKFDGFKVMGEAGKRRQWKTYLKSGNEQITLLDFRPLGEINQFGQTMLELFFSYGNAEYYMGDEYPSIPTVSTYIEYLYQTTDGIIGSSAYTDNVAWEKYKIKLISWEAAPPIENTFKKPRLFRPPPVI